MKKILKSEMLPKDSLLITCASHEERCEGLLNKMGEWTPGNAILFQYDDHNPKREDRKNIIENELKKRCETTTISFSERNIAESMREKILTLNNIMEKNIDRSVVFDISVFTKRHLLMMLRWLDDKTMWDKLYIIYSEPDDYIVSECIPLSFGISKICEIPGFSAISDTSRPLHLIIFLGYEGDRALAVYELIQPMKTTLFVPHPPYRDEWVGRTELFNSDLIKYVGNDAIKMVDAIDPQSVKECLEIHFGHEKTWSANGKIVCPLGTKPQTLGIYEYVRECCDPPSIIYAGTLRHNHNFYSSGIGSTWLLKEPV